MKNKSIIIFLIIIILLSGCVSNNSIIGTWKAADDPSKNGEVTYQFLSNGDIIYVGFDGKVVNGKFRQIDDSHIVLTFFVGEPPYKERNAEVVISGDKMTMNIERFASNLTFARVK